MKKVYLRAISRKNSSFEEKISEMNCKVCPQDVGYVVCNIKNDEEVLKLIRIAMETLYVYGIDIYEYEEE